MRETDGFRHVGVVDQRILLFAQMSALWWSSAAEPDRSARVEVMATESPHKASSARVSTSRHGQSGGERSMGRPDRLTRRPGMATVRRAGAMGLTRRCRMRSRRLRRMTVAPPHVGSRSKYPGVTT